MASPLLFMSPAQFPALSQAWLRLAAEILYLLLLPTLEDGSERVGTNRVRNKTPRTETGAALLRELLRSAW